MISSKKFIKLLSADEKETQKIIDGMLEKDAKETVKFFVEFIKNSSKSDIELMNGKNV